MANFLEKVSYRIGVCLVSPQNQHRGNQQGNAARRNEPIKYVVGLQCKLMIVRLNLGKREEDFLCTRSTTNRSSSERVMQPEQLWRIG